MSVSKLQILCQGFQWADGTDINEVNFFSDEPRTAVTSEIDLMDYAVEINELQYTFDDVDDEKGYGSLFFTSGNITIKVTDGTVNGLNMSDFFKIYEDTQYIKYKVQILYNNSLLFQGTVHQDGLKEKFSLDNDAQIIEVLVVGFEKEMKTYFNSQHLPDPRPTSTELPWQWNSYFVGGGFPAELAYSDHLKHKQFPTVLEGLLANDFINTFSYDTDISEWFMAKEGRFVISPNTDGLLHHTRNGYERFWYNGNKIWEFLEWIFKSMGWIYFIWQNTFYVRNRGGFSLPLTDLDFNNVIEYEIGKQKPIMTYDYIMFLTGAYYGGNGAFWGDPFLPQTLKGERPVILTDKIHLYKNTNHWNAANGTIGDSYQIGNGTGYIFSKYASEDSNDFRMYNINYNASEVLQQVIEAERILRIPVGSSGISWSRVRFDQGQDFPYDYLASDPSLVNFDMVYTGCAGDCMMKIIEDAKQSINYSGRYGADGYVNTEQFANNFAKFWDNRTNHYLNVKLAYLLDTPMQNFRFINSGISFFETAEWAIQSIKMNLIEETTELELLKIN